VYTVWNGSDLSQLERNHLRSALEILGHIIEELKPAQQAGEKGEST
jgi:hypothetical protein